MTSRTKCGWLTVFLLSLSLPATAEPESRTTFEVEALFDDGLLREVELDLICGSGNPKQQTRRLRSGTSFTWRVDDFKPGTTSCQLRAHVPNGFSVEYRAASAAVSRADRNGCQFAEIGNGQRHRCRIRIDQDPVSLTVYKKWIGGQGNEPDVEVRLDCDAVAAPGPRYINEGLPGSWDIRDIDPGGVRCDVTEAPRDSYVAEENDCKGLLIVPGRGEECTMVNTKIVKRIEMLNRYGKAVLVVVILVAGLIAARKYA